MKLQSTLRFYALLIQQDKINGLNNYHDSILRLRNAIMEAAYDGAHRWCCKAVLRFRKEKPQGQFEDLEN